MINGQIEWCGSSAARSLKEAHITGPELVHTHTQQGDLIATIGAHHQLGGQGILHHPAPAEATAATAALVLHEAIGLNWLV